MKKLNLLLAAMLVALAGSAYAQKADVPKSATAAPAAKEVPKEAPKDMAKDAKAELVDINSADEKMLMTLKGIGDVTAKKIIKSRPYGGKDDLVKKKVITDKVYADIKDQIIAKQKKVIDARPAVLMHSQLEALWPLLFNVSHGQTKSALILIREIFKPHLLLF